MMQQGELTQLIVYDIRQVTEEVRLYYLQEENNKKISFKAGQYLTFVFKHDEKEYRRSYSIASSPVVDEPLFIGIKRITNGNFSRKMFDFALPGDTLTTSGVGGVFTLPDDINQYKEFFFFAAGSGILPVYSLIKTILYQFRFLKVVLIYSNRSVAQTVFYDELKVLQQEFRANLHVEFLFSNNEDLFHARLHADLVISYLKTLAFAPTYETLFYICGPEAYMRFCTFVLQGQKVPAPHIKKEIFHTATPVFKIEPPDKSAHNVSIILNDQEVIVRVQYPTTILKAARNLGVNMPYSCEVGRCGNCMARCLKGKVWMSYNEVLTERELAQGLVLTCTGFPVDGDVVIKL